jgi:hypothetical protein
MSARWTECPREHETLAMVQAGRWPDGCDGEIRAHAEACAVCRDVARVGSVVAADAHGALRSVRVPASGLIWWRMQRRAREEAARTTARAITVVQAVCVTGGVAAAVALGRTFLFGAGVPAAALASWSLPLLIALAASLSLAPVAVYWAVGRE